MALKKETIQKIATILKLKEADLAAAIADTNEVDVAIGDLTTVTEEDLTRIKNEEYKNGKEKGIEMKVKEVKEKLGIDSTGKTIEGLIEAVSKKIMEDAKIAPDKKVQELEKDNQTLRTQIEDLTGKVTEKDAIAQRAIADRDLFKDVPETSMPADDFLDFARMKGYDFKSENGSVVPYKNGEPVKDSLAKVRPAKEVLADFAKEFGIAKEPTKPAGGRGGGNETPADKPMKLSELKKQFTDSNKSMLGQEFSAAVAQAAKDNPDFKMDE